METNYTTGEVPGFNHYVEAVANAAGSLAVAEASGDLMGPGNPNYGDWKRLVLSRPDRGE
jgi:hypothetical protein